jgi:hypothetical protein
MIAHRHALLARLGLAVLPLLPAASLGGCGLANRPASAEDRDARRDCDAEADRIYAVRNRYQVSERDGSDTPNSGNTLPFNPTAGLSDQYEQDKLVDSCLAHHGESQAASPTAPAAPAAPAAPDAPDAPAAPAAPR